MSTSTVQGREYVQKIARAIVTEMDPDELEFFDELAEEYYQDPTPPRANDDALGSGLGAVIVALTPAVLAMVTVVLAHLMAEQPNASGRESAAPDKQPSQASLDPQETEEAGAVEQAPLTEEQLEQVKAIARREAERFGADLTTANNMANAMVGVLALAG